MKRIFVAIASVLTAALFQAQLPASARPQTPAQAPAAQSPIAQAPAAPAPSPASAQVTVGPYLQAVTETGFTVVWDSEDATIAWVEVAPDDGTHFYNTDRAKYYQSTLGKKVVGMHHVVKVDGLEPGTTYRYRIMCRTVKETDGDRNVHYGKSFGSDVYRKQPLKITTLDTRKDSVFFAVANDYHGHPEVLENHFADASSAGYDFVFYNGDMTSQMNSHKDIIDNYVAVSAAKFAAQTPWFLSRGNHENRGLAAYNFLEYFPTTNGQAYYTFRQGPVMFMVLDPGEDKPDTDIEYGGLGDFDRYRTEEAQWIAHTIESQAWKDAPVHIVFCHIPPENGTWHGPQELYNKFVPLLNKAGIDLMICGHTHRFAYIEASNDINFPILINPNQTLLKMTVHKDGTYHYTMTNAKNEIIQTR